MKIRRVTRRELDVRTCCMEELDDKPTVTKEGTREYFEELRSKATKKGILKDSFKNSFVTIEYGKENVFTFIEE